MKRITLPRCRLGGNSRRPERRVSALILPHAFSTLVVALLMCVSLRAGTVDISIAGAFGAGVVGDSLAAPGETWAISFDVNSSPVAGNVDALGFDIPFSTFSYMLDGTAVAVTPQSIRVYTMANGGLFALFFGPETGFNNGQPIPEFSFSGSQLFSGTTASPTIIPGDYPISDVIFSDALNYDDEGASGTVSATGTTTVITPEPYTSSLLLVAVPLFLIFRIFARILQ